MDWDLNTGQVKQTFGGSGGQISAIEMRPSSSLPVPEATGEQAPISNTFLSDNAEAPRTNGVLSNGVSHDVGQNASSLENGVANAAPSPADSLFGGNDNDSLFGDAGDDNNGLSVPSFGDDYDDEFSRAIANGIQHNDNDDAVGDVSMIDAGGADDTPLMNGIPEPQMDGSFDDSHGISMARNASNNPITNGFPHAEATETSTFMDDSKEEANGSNATNADSVFLSASIDGNLRVWDKRKPNPVAKILPRNVPPWCMGACWSPDGNFIYAGRRNGTVEEFSLHKGLRGSERTFKFPNGSGPVSAVRAMPNGRHLIW